MKYDKDSPMDNILSKFPIRYIIYMGIIWFFIIVGLIYLGVK